MLFNKKIKVLNLALLYFGLSVASTYRTPSYIVTDLPAVRWSRSEPQGFLYVHASRAFASSAYDQNGDQGALFSGQGLIDFHEFGRNLPWFTGQYPETQAFIDGYKGLNFTREDKKLFVDGTAEIIDLDFILGFPSTFGVSGFLELPVRHTRIKNLQFVSMTGGSSAFVTLVNNQINPVLIEHGIEPINKDKIITLSGPGDAVLGLAWSGFYPNPMQKSLVDGIGVGIRGGLIIPTSTILGFTQQHLFSIPIGENSSFGVKLQTDCQINFRPYLSIIGYAESRVFFRHKEKLRVKVIPEQEGLTLAPLADVEYDNGHFWRLGIAGKFGVPEKGFFITGGYAYSSKERSKFRTTEQEIRNNREFKIYKLDFDINAAATDANTELVKITDQAMSRSYAHGRQYTHSLHVGFQFAPKKDIDEDSLYYDPIVDFSYHYPWFGKNYIHAPAYLGGATVGIKFSF